MNTEIISAAINDEVSEQILNREPSLNSEDVANAIVYALGTPPHVQVTRIYKKNLTALKNII